MITRRNFFCGLFGVGLPQRNTDRLPEERSIQACIIHDCTIHHYGPVVYSGNVMDRVNWAYGSRIERMHGG